MFWVIIFIVIIGICYFNKNKASKSFISDNFESINSQDISFEKNNLKDTSLYLNFFERVYHLIDEKCQQVANKHLSKYDEDIFNCSIDKDSLSFSKYASEEESGGSSYQLIFSTALFDLGYKMFTEKQVRALTELLYQDLSFKLKQRHPKIDVSYRFGISSEGVCGTIKLNLRDCYKELKDIC